MNNSTIEIFEFCSAKAQKRIKNYVGTPVGLMHPDAIYPFELLEIGWCFTVLKDGFESEYKTLSAKVYFHNTKSTKRFTIVKHWDSYEIARIE